MLKELYNEIRVHLDIDVTGPFLIKSGREGSADPVRPDMEFIRTRDPKTGKEVPFIPGTSIKGTFRSYAEKIGRTLELGICDPLEKSSCSEKNKNTNSYTISFQQHCLVCQLFGSLKSAGRIHFQDAYPTTDLTPYLSQRNSVGIDRVLGSASGGALFDFEVLTGGTFQTTLSIRNFTTWQIGLLAIVLRDLGDGWIRMGFGKSRGLGNVSGRVTGLELRSISPTGLVRQDDQLEIFGVGELAPTAADYGFPSVDRITLPAASFTLTDDIFPSLRLHDAQPVDMFLAEAVRQGWKPYVDQYAHIKGGTS